MNPVIELIISLVFFLVILLFTYFLFRFIFRMVRRALVKSEFKLPTLLIGFGISLMLFPKTIIFFLRDLINFTVKFISIPFDIFYRFFQSGDTSSSIYGNIELYMATKSITINFLSNQDFKSLILFFIVWILISLTIKRLTVGSTSVKNENLEILRKNILSIVVLLIAVYLSMTAIIAIPIVNYKSNLKADEIDSLNRFLTKDLSKIYSLYVDSSIFYTLNDYDKKDTAFVNNYNKLQEEYIILKDQSLRKLENKRQQARIRFQEVFLMKTKDKAKLRYRADLTNWYLKYQEDVLYNLDKAKLNLRTLGLDSLNKSPEVINDNIFERNGIYVPLIEYLKGLQEDKLNSATPPPVPRPGDNFNIFGVVAGWLVDTEDIAFVLIIGLLGFGLLGSTGSEIIKGSKNPEPNKLIINNLYGAIVKGTSAALVVFLAVKGGMAIITSSDTDNLNPYSLFFICFVAAVYSSDVWDWAKKKFLEKMGIKPEEQKKV